MRSECPPRRGGAEGTRCLDGAWNPVRRSSAELNESSAGPTAPHVLHDRARLNHARIVVDREQARDLRARHDADHASQALQLAHELANFVSDPWAGKV